MVNGIINVYKEKGFTSHDVVAKLRGILKQKKIGHTGTLDPDAVGVLPVCLGKGTKVCDLLTNKDKTYEAKMHLGIVTDTQDMSGTVLEEHPVEVTEKQVKEVILSFVGEYQQVPPMYSAIKYNGKKLYELARAGKEVKRQARTVRILDIQIKKIELPFITMEVSCSKGTYIRTLCQDIGERLGCGACLETLKRIKVGSFEIKDSVTLQQIEQYVKSNTLSHILHSVDSMFEAYPKLNVKEPFNRIVYNGNPIFLSQCQNCEGNLDKVRVYDSKGEFIGIYQWQSEKERFAPIKIFWETK